MQRKFIFIFLLFFVANFSFAQPWMNYLDQNKKREEITFFDIQDAYQKYCKANNIEEGYKTVDGKRIKEGTWTKFKRWEWYWEVRVDPQTGKFPETSAYNELNKKKQQSSFSSDKSSDWVNLGTNSSAGGYAGIGRINAVGFHPDNEDIFWVGSPSGGLWKTTDGGNSWNVQTDNNAVMGVSDIVIPSDYASTETVYISTGDRDARDNYTVGVLKSEDGGNTWQQSLVFNVGDRELINRLIIHPTDNNTLFAATTDGVMKTSNGGDSWTTISSVVLKDMEFKPGDPSVMYGSTYSDPTVIYKSSNGGNDWSESLSLSAQRIELAVTADNPEVVYAVVSNSNSGLKGIYKSTDAGDNFELIYDSKNLLGWNSSGTDNGGQGWYDLTIAADPNHADTVFVGGVNSWRSTDGGNSWALINHWTGDGAQAVHADKHAMEYRNGTSVLYEGNDGGIYKTTNNGQYWEDRTNGMVISQIYKIGTSQSSPDVVINGLQDNGTKMYDEGSWQDVLGGDGMDCMIDYTNEFVQYGSYYYGAIYRTSNKWSSATDIKPASAGDGAWVTPMIMDPDDPNTIYAGYADLWKSTDKGSSWSQISDVNSSYYKIRSMAISSSNPDYIYMADLYNIWRTTNAGSSWAEITNNLPSSSAITNIEIKNDDPETLWVTLGNYNTDNVYKSTDGGASWTDVSAGLPNVPVLDIVQNQSNISDVELYAGTDIGVYKKVNNDQWTLYSNNLPNVIVNDLEFYYDTQTGKNLLRAGTYGRGLWETEVQNESFIANPANIETTIDYDHIDISWDQNTNSDSVLLVWNSVNTFGDPQEEISYSAGDELSGGGTVLYFNDVTSQYTHNALQSNEKYYYKIWSYDGSGYSTGVNISASTTCQEPTAQVSDIQFENLSETELTLNWQRGTGDKLLIVASEGSPVYEDPVNSVEYTASSTFGSGEELGSGSYAVYKGIEDSVRIDGLKEGTIYYFKLFEYNAADFCYMKPALSDNITTVAAGFDSAEEMMARLYPNPASAQFTVEGKALNGRIDIDIIDVNGRKVHHASFMENENKVISTHDIGEGIFIVFIKTENKIWRRKLIVQ